MKMPLTKNEINGIFILILFISGIILAVLGHTLIINNTLVYMGIGLLSSGMAISLMELLKRQWTS